MLVDAWLPRAAAAAPGRVAVQTPAGSWTYAELLDAARAGAARLARRGVIAGDRVAVNLPAGLAFAQAMHAALLLGAIVVPVDPRLGETERRLVTEGPRWCSTSRSRTGRRRRARVLHATSTTTSTRSL